MENSNKHWERFIYWFCFNIAIASLPLLMVWLMKLISGLKIIDKNNDLPELLFFSLVFCISTVGDIEIRKNSQIDYIKFLILKLILLVGAILSSIMYGAVKIAATLNSNFQIQSSAFWLIIFSIIFLFGLSIISQVFITKSDMVDNTVL